MRLINALLKQIKNIEKLPSKYENMNKKKNNTKPNNINHI